MTFDFQDVVLVILWASMGALMLSLVLAMSLNKTVKAKAGCVLAVALLFALLVAWADHKFFKQPWHTELPVAQIDDTRCQPMLALHSTPGKSAHA